MRIRIEPVTGRLNGRMNVPGSKSLANRALICAALAKGRSELVNASDSDDTALMANGLNQLGVVARPVGSTLFVDGQGGILTAPKFPIPVGNAGTTFRFLLSAAALASGVTRFELSPRMAERPLDDLIEGLADLGVRVERDISGLFVSVHGGGIRGGRVTIRGNRSSQFLSSLLLVSPMARDRVSIAVEGPIASEPYVAMTRQVMRQFGVQVEESRGDERLFEIEGSQRYRPARFTVEPDASGASYPFAAAAIAGGSMFVGGMQTKSVQGDAAFLRTLALMGCSVEETPAGVAVTRDAPLRGIDMDMNMMPDVVPTLVATALFADGPTRIRNVGHLRFKESNRLETLADELRKLGARIEVHEDGLSVQPGPLHGAELHTHDDHRLAMSFALIGLKVSGVTILGAECVRKSYPEFWDELGSVTKISKTT